ncbi:aminopeptidase N [Methylocystis bryophila]|uniref:Aminopeptidase N n=1 Tax=Methylocystis bryophila TaxID=655015 RepID=A0A1W6MXI3_9HYPH|nr:aminopeptidase N [Methylocystis bryophila]ARN82300.1 aminopeptidase N [Methylocystis bryophila]BDV38450.1 aminopeptidase N [Methylocystis bryophila]
MRNPPPQPIRLKDYAPPDFLIDSVELFFSLHKSKTRVRSRLALRRNPKGRSGAPLVLDGDDLTLERVSLDGRPLDREAYETGPENFKLAQPPEGPFILEIETLVDPTANTQLSGLYRSGANYCTQCEAQGFRRITYFLDRPDALAVYTTRIEADKSEAPLLLSNGDLVEAGALEAGRHFAVWRDPYPKPCYLFALVGGDLGSISRDFTTKSGRKVKLSIFVEHGKEARADYAMDALERAMRWDEERFGREYDLDVFNIVAVSDFNMGAMENKGLNIFNDKYVLASPQTATDADYAAVEAVIAHEYFHNWTGNRITCRDWFQLCLKEGLTVYRDQEFSADMRSRAVKRINDVRTLRLTQFVEDAGPLAHPVRPDSYRAIDNFYTATVYEKGAEIVRMLNTLIGAEAFARGMEIYFTRFDGTAATVEDFLSCFAESAKRDLSQFARWYSQAGTPVVEVATRHDPQTRVFSLTLSQSTPPTPGQEQKLPLEIPIALALFDAAGNKLALETNDAKADEIAQGRIVLSSETRTLRFPNLAAAPSVSLLRGFSAPARLEPPVGEADLLRLLAHDDDPFNRWQASQSLALRSIFARVRGEERTDDAFADGLGRLISQSNDPAFTALALTFPSEADLAREQGEDVDPDALHAARKALRETLGHALKTSLAKILERLTEQGAYSPDAASAGRRALHNVALDLLAAGDGALGTQLAEAHFNAARNMTDRLAALGTLALVGGDARENAFARFYEEFAEDSLVIDKWFSLQATIPEEATTRRVLDLLAHKDFSLSNPNRARALLGAFAAGNPTRFHARDGSGYALFVDAVISIDPKNPQLAARLLTSLRSWRTLEPDRRRLAEEALRRVAAVPTLSGDTNDIATRALA